MDMHAAEYSTEYARAHGLPDDYFSAASISRRYYDSQEAKVVIYPDEDIEDQDFWR
jgi:hypothetical protein